MTINLFLLFTLIPLLNCEKNDLIKENILGNKLSHGVSYLTRYLEVFNDNNLGSSELGKWLGYCNIKPNLKESGRGVKKMSMQMMPLVFHVGASSTWLVLTALMAAKSVAIGLLLLIFKIAVSSAKVASFFTLLKSKSETEHSWSHGYERSLFSDDYHTIPAYKENHISSDYQVIENIHDKSDNTYG